MITQTRLSIFFFLLTMAGAVPATPLFPSYLHCADREAEVDSLDFNFSKVSIFIEGSSDDQTLRWDSYGKDTSGGISSQLEETHDYMIWRGNTDDIVPFTLAIHRIAQPGTFLRPASLYLNGKQQNLKCYFASGQNTGGLCDLYAFPADPVFGAGAGFRITGASDLVPGDKAALLARLQASPVVKSVKAEDDGTFHVTVREERPFSELHTTLRATWCRDQAIRRVEIAPHLSVSSAPAYP